MAHIIDISSAINRDREALFVWATMPQQRSKYPDFERLLYALPYTSKRSINDGNNNEVTYIHLDVARDGCKSLYIRLSKATDKRGPGQMDFLGAKEREGCCAGNCMGWEDARDVIVRYMAYGEPVKPLPGVLSIR